MAVEERIRVGKKVDTLLHAAINYSQSILTRTELLQTYTPKTRSVELEKIAQLTIRQGNALLEARKLLGHGEYIIKANRA